MLPEWFETARADAERTRAEGQPFAKRVPAVVAGQRRVLDVFELGVKKGPAAAPAPAQGGGAWGAPIGEKKGALA